MIQMCGIYLMRTYSAGNIQALRFAFFLISLSSLSPGPNRALYCVITSYSIHYTKLYEVVSLILFIYPDLI